MQRNSHGKSRICVLLVEDFMTFWNVREEKKTARSSLSSIQTRNIAEHEKCFDIKKKPKARSVLIDTFWPDTRRLIARPEAKDWAEKRGKKLWFYNRANWSISPILIALSLRLIPLSEYGEFVVFDFRFFKTRDEVVWVAVVQWIFRLLAMLSQQFGKTLK